MQGKHNVRARRDAADLTQKSLGAIAGVSSSTISHIECHRGPDVPRSERRLTKTRLSTALRLSVALSGMKPGEYTLEDFVRMQNIFGENELYEAAINQRERERRRQSKQRRHLRSVA